MIWPVAALAVFLLGFVIFYGSRLQARVAAGTHRVPEDSGVETEIA
jgi:predicted ABC-type ATPase